MGFLNKYEKLFDCKSNSVTQLVSDTQAYFQFGNAVVVLFVAGITKVIISRLKITGAL